MPPIHRRVPARLLALLVGVLALAAGPAAAHFSEGTKVRTVVVAPAEEGLVAYLRVPAPLLWGDAIAEATERRAPIADPALRAETLGPAIRYRIALDAIDPGALAERLATAHEWRQNGRPVEATVLDWRILGRDPQTGFGSAEDARAAMAGDGARLDPVFGDAVIEVALALDAPTPGADLVLRAAHPALTLPGGVTIDNHLRDERGAGTSRVVEGQLQEPVTFDGSRLAAAGGFVWQGVLHIVEGPDHVLLVMCIALGAGLAMRLVWLVTAFTLGHAATLAVSFLGYVPQAPWFIPAVEAAIAATVLYAAWAAWRGRLEAAWLMGGIGLLHGLGFSFVLAEILGRDAPGVVPALAAFTIGIELGQIAILAATLLAARLVAFASGRAELVARTAVLGGIGAVAAFWTVERALALA